MNSNILLLRNGVDLDLFSPKEDLRPVLKKKYSLKYDFSVDKIIVGFVADTINEWMDLDSMLDSTKHYSKNIHFIIVGGSNRTKDVNKKDYNNITFIDQVSNLELSFLLNIFDLCLYSLIKQFYHLHKQMLFWYTFE